MAPIDRRVRLWAWIVHRQGSIASRSEAEVIALQARHTPDNALTNRIFGDGGPGRGGGGPDHPGAGRRPHGTRLRARSVPFRRSASDRLLPWRRVCLRRPASGRLALQFRRRAGWRGRGSVEYRLAPRHRFPAAVDDCYAALVWAAENAAGLGADGPVGVMGESAGANLSAVMCLLARDRGGPPQPSGVALPGHRHVHPADRGGRQPADHPPAGNARLPPALPGRRRSPRSAGVTPARRGPQPPAPGADPGGRPTRCATMEPAMPRPCEPRACRCGSPSTSACRTAISTSLESAGAHRRPWPNCARSRPPRWSSPRRPGSTAGEPEQPSTSKDGEATAVHWSIPDPVPAGDPGSFDAALAQLADRVGRLAAVS